MRRYAQGTDASVEKSRAELETLLGRHGAGRRAIASDDDKAVAHVLFVIHDRQYRLDLPMPKRNEHRRQGAWEQACRERWRAIVLMVKAKLELARIGVSSIEREFLADMVLADGTTMHLAVAESIRTALAEGRAPTLMLPAPSERKEGASV
jgi:hypothetical protein